MNPATTSCHAPAPAGMVPAAPPADVGLDAILADPRLSSTAKVVAVALVRHWAWHKPVCWPADATIARKVGKSVGHVRRCLRELELAGLIAREPDTAVGRLIWLRWRQAPCTDDMGYCAPARIGSIAPARTEELRTERTKEERNVTALSFTQSGTQDSYTPPALVAAPEPEPVVTPAPTPAIAAQPQPVIPIPPVPSCPPAPISAAAPAIAVPAQPAAPLQATIRALPGNGSQAEVRQTAWRIAHALRDTSSIGFYLGVMAQVVAGTVPAEAVVAAFRAGAGAIGKARSSGAIFTWTLRNWQPPPKPSEINRPQYHTAQARSPGGYGSAVSSPGGFIVHKPSASAPAPAIPEVVAPADAGPVDLEYWREIAGCRSHPLKAYAQRVLAGSPA